MIERRFDGSGERRLEETKRLGRVLKVAGMLTSSPHSWTRAGLAKLFEVNERSIDRDLEMLRGLGYEIAHSRSGYAFTRTPALPPVTLTLPEVLALTLAALLARDSGDIDTASLGAALAQLEARMPASARPLIRQELLNREATARSHERRRAALELMQRAWLERRRVRMVYVTNSRGGAVSERVVEPYVVYPYERSWMVTAYDHQRAAVRIFKIDRIQEAVLLDETYTIPEQFDLATYRGVAWGVLRGYGDEPADVALLFDAESGRWVEEEQRDERMTFERQADGSVLVSLNVGITPEFVRWILWYGPHCRVLAPDSLRAQVRAAAQTIVDQYSGSSADQKNS